jgi:hypothetical protein
MRLACRDGTLHPKANSGGGRPVPRARPAWPRRSRRAYGARWRRASASPMAVVTVEWLQVKIRTWQRRTAKAEAPLQAYAVGCGISRDLYTMDCLTSPNGETTRRRWPAGPSSLLQGTNTQQQHRPCMATPTRCTLSPSVLPSTYPLRPWDLQCWRHPPRVCWNAKVKSYKVLISQWNPQVDFIVFKFFWSFELTIFYSWVINLIFLPFIVLLMQLW